MNKITIIGAGAAGIGMGVILKQLNYPDFQIIEQGEIGDSFQKWPNETRFITSSFTSNGFGMPDLNAVTIDTSPAYTFGMEHLSGRQYAHYLKLVAQAYQLPIIEHTTAKDILTVDDGYQVITNQGTITTKYLIMAVGQYHTPRLTPHPENVVHYSQVDSWESFSGHDQIIVGANESGIDAAINLAQLGDKVTVITDETGLDADEADPSIRLAPHTRHRFMNLLLDHADRVNLVRHQHLVDVIHNDHGYELLFEDGRRMKSKERPILCTGFAAGPVTLWPDLFRFDGHQMVLNEFDESTVASNIFVVGPDVRHQDAIFCYIYKFRQRFSVVMEEIAKREGLDISDLIEANQRNDFYLDDCGSCGVACRC